jgi:CheY-like chemotaxis protein
LRTKLGNAQADLWALGESQILNKGMLLVAEDEALILLGVQGVLEDAGYDVLVAGDGEQACDVIDQHISGLSGMISDIRLGHGPDGWSLARKARQIRPDLPVIYISGDSAGDWNTQGVTQSVMIAKPFTPSQILGAVSKLVDAAP